jgi:hypothetical protein
LSFLIDWWCKSAEVIALRVEGWRTWRKVIDRREVPRLAPTNCQSTHFMLSWWQGYFLYRAAPYCQNANTFFIFFYPCIHKHFSFTHSTHDTTTIDTMKFRIRDKPFLLLSAEFITTQNFIQGKLCLKYDWVAF